MRDIREVPQDQLKVAWRRNNEFVTVDEEIMKARLLSQHMTVSPGAISAGRKELAIKEYKLHMARALAELIQHARNEYGDHAVVAADSLPVWSEPTIGGRPGIEGRQRVFILDRAIDKQFEMSLAYGR